MFHVGQKVAALCMNPRLVVIPAAVVTDFKFVARGDQRLHPITKRIFRTTVSGWRYKIDAHSSWLKEHTLRKLNDDDYSEPSHQSLSEPAGGV